MMPVAELTSKYYKSAFYEDELTIKTEIENYSPVRIKFKYSVYNQKNELINIGTSMHAWTGTDLKIMNLKKKFPEIYAKIETIGTNK
jgi:acyl-CoA thioester hydrolase